MQTETSVEKKDRHRQSVARWKAIVAEFEKPNPAVAWWQILNSVGGYALLWAAMYWTSRTSWWLTIPLAVLAGGLLVRVFIIFHDCGHGSFFRETRANRFWGFVTGVLAFTPFDHWRWEHAVHHASNGDLDRRGVGDIWTMTVEEYQSATPGMRFAYRVFRNPVVLFFIAPIFVFVVLHRIPGKTAKPRERRSVWLTNAGVVALAALLIWLFGFWPWLIIQSVVLLVGCSAGVWLFYVQHQFEDVHWERGDNWDFTVAALKGSSFYRLPAVLQWFSGNIGYHHVHHLSARIPNYNLQRCHAADPIFREAREVGLLESLGTMRYRLWDEREGRLIGFRELEQRGAGA